MSDPASPWRAPGVVIAGMVLAAVAAVLGSSAGHEAHRRVGGLDRLAERGSVVTVEAVALTEPVPVARAPTGSAPQVRLRMRVEQVTHRGMAQRVSTPVVVVADREQWSAVGWRDRVMVTGRLASVGPGEDVLARLSPRGPPRALGEAGPVRSSADHLRDGLRASVEPLPDDASGLLPALVIGDTSRTPDDLSDDMLVVGMSHLSAVSGSNVAIVLAAILGASRVVGIPRRWRPWVALCGLAFFVVLARPEPSVIRAAVMGAIGVLGLSLSRRAAGVPALCAAVLLLLMIDPWLARSYGFVLSALATLGLLLFAGGWSRAINAHLPSWAHVIGPAVAIPVAAQLVCAPVVVLLQGNVSVVAVVANLLAAPLVAPATIAGVGAALLGALWTPAGMLLAWCGAPFAQGIAVIARRAADLPGNGAIGWPDGPPGALLLTALTAAGVLTGPWLLVRALRHPIVVASAAAIALAMLAPDRWWTWPPPDWRMVACDVGQGDALVLATGPGRAVLVDAGPDPRAVDGCLSRLGVDHLDAVLLTHLDADHIGGLSGALSGRSTGQILTSPWGQPPAASAEVSDLARSRDTELTTIGAGARLRVGPINLTVLAPLREVAGGSATNNASLVLAVRTGDLDAVLLGDIEREAGAALVGAWRRQPQIAPPAPDVVKVAHHGSGNVDEALMERLGAPVAVISVGADNDYGHPAPSVLRWWGERGTRVTRTDTEGDIAILDGGRVITSR